MIRISEAVLAGHPDKFCDQVADAVIAACMAVDADAYGQVEVAAWSDEVWLNGGICTRTPMPRALADLVVETGRAIGYAGGNWIDAARYRVTDAVCRSVGDPTAWTAKVNDQSVVIGWAGYDAKVRYLPPEHFLAQAFREALMASCRRGRLKGQGPDGKLLVRLKEHSAGWELEHVLVTLQQRERDAFADVCEALEKTLAESYEALRAADRRWTVPWAEVRLMINPNGPLVNGGSDGDNGQTGRKLAMDFYGPRVPIGGGALSGKHLSHIDRIGAYAAREAAVRAVQSGAAECLVRVAWAPNVAAPLDVCYEMAGRGGREGKGFFEHLAMIERYRAVRITRELAEGRHFFDPALPWNGGAGGDTP